MGIRKVLISVLLIGVLSAALVCSVSAAGQPTAEIVVYGDTLVPWISFPSDTDLLSVDLYYSAYDESAWHLLRRIPVEDYLETIRVDASLWIAGNKFRLRVECEAYDAVWSNTVTVPVEPLNFGLTISNNNTVSWNWVGYPVTLHFIWYDNWVAIWNENSSSLPPNQPAQPQTFDITVTSYDTLYSSPYIDTYEQLRYTLGVYATCSIAGHTYTSNTVYRVGRDTINSSPAVTGSYYSPLVNDVNSTVSMLYRSTRNTPVWYYVLSALVICLPCIGVAFILKRF